MRKFLAVAVAAGALIVPIQSARADSVDEVKDQPKTSAAAPLSLGTGTATQTAGAAPAPGSAPSGAAAATPGAGNNATAPSAYDLGKVAVANSDWPTAIAQFTTATTIDPRNADAFNMLAFSYRKSGDLDLAFKHYNTALKLNPNHRGANEYIGEAYLLKGNLTKAKAHLARLAKICGTKCEQYVDLKADIAAYGAKAKKK